MSEGICCDLPSRREAADTKKRCTIQLIYVSYLNATKKPSCNDLFNFVLIWSFVLCFVGLFATDDFQYERLNCLRHRPESVCDTTNQKISVKDVQRSRCKIQACSFCFLLSLVYLCVIKMVYILYD